MKAAPGVGPQADAKPAAADWDAVLQAAQAAFAAAGP